MDWCITIPGHFESCICSYSELNDHKCVSKDCSNIYQNKSMQYNNNDSVMYILLMLVCKFEGVFFVSHFGDLYRAEPG